MKLTFDQQACIDSWLQQGFNAISLERLSWNKDFILVCFCSSYSVYLYPSYAPRIRCNEPFLQEIHYYSVVISPFGLQTCLKPKVCLDSTIRLVDTSQLISAVEDKLIA